MRRNPAPPVHTLLARAEAWNPALVARLQPTLTDLLDRLVLASYLPARASEAGINGLGWYLGSSLEADRANEATIQLAELAGLELPPLIRNKRGYRAHLPTLPAGTRNPRLGSLLVPGVRGVTLTGALPFNLIPFWMAIYLHLEPDEDGESKLRSDLLSRSNDMILARLVDRHFMNPSATTRALVKAMYDDPYARGLWVWRSGDTFFRFSEDGTCADSDDNAIPCPKSLLVSLPHPIDIPAEELSRWRQLFDDYMIVQPAPQINRPLDDTPPEQRAARVPVLDRTGAFKETFEGALVSGDLKFHPTRHYQILISPEPADLTKRQWSEILYYLEGLE